MGRIHAAAVAAAAGALGLLAGACSTFEAPEAPTGPLWFSVTFAEEPGGLNSANPLSFSHSPRDFRLNIQAYGRDKEIDSSFSGALTVHVTTGSIDSSPTLSLSDGRATATISVKSAYDALRIWVSDEGTDEEPGSFASGAAPTVYILPPTVAQMQESDSVIESELEHSYVPILGWDPDLPEAQRRQLLVTTVTNDGFYVTDTSDDPGSYNSLFVFTFSRPDEIVEGARLSQLAGIIEEFLGFTEMQFPTYSVDSTGHTVPEPYVLDASIVCDSPEMEKWESSVVRLNNLTSNFTASDCQDYQEYAQWPALVDGSCDGGEAEINVVNANTVPSFSFPECETTPPQPVAERQLDYLVGILRHTRYASPPWILEVRSCLDFPPADRPEDCEQLLLRPPSGPRKAPHPYYRDIPSCEGVPYSLD